MMSTSAKLRDMVCPASALGSFAVSAFIFIVCATAAVILTVGVVLTFTDAGALTTDSSIAAFVCECIGVATLLMCVLIAGGSTMYHTVEMVKRGVAAQRMRSAEEQQSSSCDAGGEAAAAEAAEAEAEEGISEASPLIRT
tara:strand:- start:205 stop:624 length:420 start_codon:yes stop_codon:yes gene_type:complete